MPYVVLFKDNPDAPADLRQIHMADHLTFLERNGKTITVAGPLHDHHAAGAGGIWVVNADSTEAVEALIQAGSFWPTGLRDTHQILCWTQVFREGKRQIQDKDPKTWNVASHPRL